MRGLWLLYIYTSLVSLLFPGCFHTKSLEEDDQTHVQWFIVVRGFCHLTPNMLDYSRSFAVFSSRYTSLGVILIRECLSIDLPHFYILWERNAALLLAPCMHCTAVCCTYTEKVLVCIIYLLPSWYRHFSVWSGCRLSVI